MSCESKQWDISCSERAMRALVQVLATIPGVKNVYRDRVGTSIPTRERPAIVIDEDSQDVAWQARHSERLTQTTDGVVLGLYGVASKSGCTREFGRSEVNRAFVHQVALVLAANPQLTCQLADEAEDTDHVQDVLPNGYSVTFVEQRGTSDTLALMALRIRGYDSLESRETNTWTQIVLTLSPEPTVEDNGPIDSTKQVSIDLTDNPLTTFEE